MAIAIPQTSFDVREFVKGVDDQGELIFDQVQYTDLDFSALTGAIATSGTANTTGIGIKNFTLDEDMPHIKAGVLLEIRCMNDTIGWDWGIVLEKNYDALPAQIRFMALRTSEVSSPGVNWEIQVVSGPLLGFSPDATIGFCETLRNVPDIDQVITTDNILADKLVSRNMTLLFSNVNDFETYYRVRVLDYDEDTGDVEYVVTARNDPTEAEAGPWIVTLIPGPVSGDVPPPTTFTKIADATGTQTITIPNDTQVGDLIVLGVLHVTEDGLGAINGVNELFFRIADGTEAGLVVDVFSDISLFTTVPDAQESWSFPGSGESYSSLIAVFRHDGGGTISVGGGVGDDQPFPATLVVPANSGVSPLVVIGCYSSEEDVSTRSMTPTKDGEIGGTTFWLAWKIFNSDPVSVTIGGSEFAQAITGCYFMVEPLPTEPGDVVVFEDDGNGNPIYPEADGSRITGLFQARAFWSGTVTPTALGINISSVNNGTNVVTITAHGLTTGMNVTLTGSQPAGLTTNTAYYVRVIDANTLSFYTTYADALNDTNRVDITGTTTGGSMRFLNYTDVHSGGIMSSVAPVGYVPGSTTTAIEFNFTEAPGFCVAPQPNTNGLEDTTGAIGRILWSTTVKSGQTVSFLAGLGCRASSASVGMTTIAAQGTSAWEVEGFILF